MSQSIANVMSELEQRLERTIVQRFRELPYVNGDAIPTELTLEPGATSVSVDAIRGYGTAALLSPQGTDIPLVQIDISKDQAPIVMAVAGYRVSFQTQRAYDFTGKSDMITDKSVMMVRRAIDERLNSFAAYGEPAIGARGLYNPVGVTPVVSAFNPNTADYSAWIAFLMGLVLNVSLGTNDLQIPTDICLSEGIMRAAALVTDPQNADVSVMQAVRSRLDAMGDLYRNIRFRYAPESNSAVLEAKGIMTAGTNRDRIVVYRKDLMCLSRQMESSIAQMFPAEYVQQNGPDLGITYPMFSCASATQLHETNSLQLIDVTKVV